MSRSWGFVVFGVGLNRSLTPLLATRESDSRATAKRRDRMASPQQGGLSMKIAFLAIALAAATSAQAGDLLPSHGSGVTPASGKSAASSLSFEAAGRKGSKRIGGSGKSGKGGHYVGGRK